MLRKVKTGVRILAQAGPWGVVHKLGQKCGIRVSLSNKNHWRINIQEEVQWWDEYLRKEVVPKGNEYVRLRADTPLQERIVELLPADRQTVHILDVGAGPLTYLGRNCPGRTIRITAVDPLAVHYDRLLAKHGITPLVRTVKAEGESLTRHFAPDTFDLVYARNCIDHSYDPEKAILEMIAVARPGCFVLMEHHPNEAETVSYVGLHQWNFSTNDAGDFVIRSHAGETNITRKHQAICSIRCATINDGEWWLIARIRKNPRQ
jgi:SAM-dependent methyltransferase